MKNYTYENEFTKEISFPLGGIGTGSIGLAGNGRLKDWEIFNRPSKGSLNGMSHFAIKAESEGEVIDVRMLQGDLYGSHMGERGEFDDFYAGYGWGPRRENLCGMPHFKDHSFTGTFPTAKIDFTEASMPCAVSMTSWSPFIPGNAKDSSLPGAVFEIEIMNDRDKTLDYTVVCALSNPFGNEGGLNSYARQGTLHQLTFSNANLDKEDVNYGDMTVSTDAEDISYQEYWFRGTWCDDLEIYWRELTEQSRFTNRTYTKGKQSGYTNCDTGHLAAHVTLAAGEKRRVRFFITWNVPNNHNYWKKTEAYKERVKEEGLSEQWKNYYATQWVDSKESGTYLYNKSEHLKTQTYLFKDALFESSMPAVAIEALSANLSTLRSPVCLRLEDGTFYGWEGAGYTSGSCEGSCTHVWNYAQALPFLFPELERSMRKANYTYSIDLSGGSHFRLMLPLGVHALKKDFRPCADGQFGDVIKTYRDWKICGDTDWLRGLWPNIKKSIEYAWSSDNPDQWDPNQTGVLWGRQHHTLDMELFGPNAWLTGYYLAALKAASEMAEYCHDQVFGQTCRALFNKGQKWAEANLFNGAYYHQKIDLSDKSVLEPYAKDGDRDNPYYIMNYYWDPEHKEVKYQVGEGCEIDMTIAQWHANMYGLGEIYDANNVKIALENTYKNNYFESMRNIVNPWRNYAINDEAGLQICTWPEGTKRPHITLPYCQEDQGGYSYAAAIHMIQSGLIDQGMAIVKAQREKYDGYKRNPWNEIECGSNYARAMATYSLMLSFSGFQYDMTQGMIGFKPLVDEVKQNFFWSLESAWGRVFKGPEKIELKVLNGQVNLKKFKSSLANKILRIDNDGLDIHFSKSSDEILVFDQNILVSKTLSLYLL